MGSGRGLVRVGCWKRVETCSLLSVWVEENGLWSRSDPRAGGRFSIKYSFLAYGEVW